MKPRAGDEHVPERASNGRGRVVETGDVHDLVRDAAVSRPAAGHADAVHAPRLETPEVMRIDADMIRRRGSSPLNLRDVRVERRADDDASST